MTEFKLPTAAAEHELLKPFEGQFESTVRMWMGPGDPMVSTGKLVNTFQLNGLFLHQDYHGDATDGPFPSFEGKGYWGYNQTLKRYEGFWIDNVSTIMQYETGQVDESGRVWTMTCQVPNPMSGELMDKKSVITLIDNDHNKIEMFYKLPDGSEAKNMEIEYERI